MRPAAALITLALTTLLLAACGGSDSGDTKSTNTTPTTPTKPIPCPEGSDFDATTLTGKEEKDARALAKKNGCEMRVTERDGEMFPMTMDYRTDRVNVIVTDGKVSSVTGIG